MKKIILIMAAAVLALSASAQNLKFAHVNFNELVMLMPEADAARAQMEASQKEAQETYQTMVEEYQAKAQKFQQNQATWTAAIKESKQKELADISNRIQEFDQSIQQELQQQQSQLMAPIQQKAIEAVNIIAPEHLEICVDDPFAVLNSVQNAGSIFLGKNVPEALGDYFAGPNHTLPTSGTARFSSPLGVDDFVKKSSFIYYTREALGEVQGRIANFAEHEGLHAHARSVTIRFEE